MKIAIFIDVFPHLCLTYVIDQVVALIEKGNEVTIFSFVRGKEEIMHPSVNANHLLEKTYYFDIPQNFLLRFLKLIKLFILHYFRNPAIIKAFNFKKFGFEVFSLKLFYVYLAFINKQNNDYDIIHAHFGPSGNFAVKLKELGIKGKFLVTFYGYDFSQYVKSKGKKVYCYLFDKADKIIAISQYVENKLVELGCQKEKLICLPLPIVINNFKFKERNFNKEETVKILTVARLVEKKGLEYSIRAVKKVLEKYPRVHYTIIGNGFLKKRLNCLINVLHCRNKISILSGMESSRIIEEYIRSHIFILSSVTAINGDEEGQGLVLQEAQAMGLPVIATRHNGFPEGLIEGKSGFLVPEKDVVALAEKIKYLIKHPELWAHMGRNGRKFIENKYDIKIIIDKLTEIYANLLLNNSE